MPRIKLTETKQPAPIRLYPSEREYIEAKYSNLSEAIRLLTKGGKYEEQQRQIELLTKQIKNLQK